MDRVQRRHHRHRPPPAPENDFPGNAAVWIWERCFRENTGGPNQKWNVRREWSRRPADHRELYYSGVDGRIHLFGAEEGWIEIGHFAGLDRLGECRMFDTDGDGFFDRWEIWTGDAAQPARVSQVRDEKAIRLPFDVARLRKFYTQRVLPEVMAANRKLLAAMDETYAVERPPGLVSAMADPTPGFARYAQEVAIGGTTSPFGGTSPNRPNACSPPQRRTTFANSTPKPARTPGTPKPPGSSRAASNNSTPPTARVTSTPRVPNLDRFVTFAGR